MTCPADLDGRPGVLVDFVRSTLGCGCPAEVLARITVDRSAGGEIGLDVGGRLLVRILKFDTTDTLIDEFPELVARMRRERDDRGFNRVRMVVPHAPNQPLGEILDRMLEAETAADDRIHVHVLCPEVVPLLVD